MKKRIQLLIFTITLIMLQGCYLKSVHPLFSDEDSMLLQGLDGTYQSDDQRWTFASDKDPAMVAELIRKYPDESISVEPGEEDSLGINAYLVLFENRQSLPGKPVLFLGTVGEINGDHYLNLKILDLNMGESSSFVESHRFNVNTFSRIKVSEEGLTMEPFASNWMKDQIMNNRVRIKHEVVYSQFDESSEILVTAPTHELQQFIQKYGKNEEAFEDPIRLNRVPNEVQ